MGKFVELFGDPAAAQSKPRKVAAPGSKPKSKKKPVEDNRGCEHCPLNKIKGIKKIFGEVAGKDVALFAQSPGPDENDAGVELVGQAGQWLWRELKRVGLRRRDCDVQNVGVRCFPADWIEGSYSSYLKMRGPSAKELKCCSYHNEQMLPKIKAKQILIFGQIAAKAILNTRSLPDQKIFWSEKLNARVYLLDHPSYFVRGAPEERLDAFRKTLDIFAKDRLRDSGAVQDPFDYIRKQDYRLVRNREEALQADKIIRHYARKGCRVGVDIENDVIDDKERVTIIGFCPKPGLSFVFVTCHREQQEQDGREVEAIAKVLLEDPAVQQVYHYGCSDCVKLRECESITVPREAYTHDTNLSEYLRFPDLKAAGRQHSYSLAAIAEDRFPEFSGYKNIATREFLAAAQDAPPSILRAPLDVQSKYVKRKRLFRASILSLETMRLYNGADADLTKRIEVDNKKHVVQPLLQLYIDLNFILLGMEPHGPLFDYEQHAKLVVLYPVLAAQKLAEMREILGDPEFNPASHPQVYQAIYSKLQLEYPFDGKPNTQKGTMQMLAQQYRFPGLVIEWRKLDKALGTYIEGYKKCADIQRGRLRTKFWSTGTRTGRLSSGAGRKGEAESEGLVNLQNIIKVPSLQNMLVSDTRWKRVYRVTGKLINRYAPAVYAFWAEQDCWKQARDTARKANVEFTESKPVPSDELQQTLELAGRKIEKWLRKHLPDFRVFLMLDYSSMEVRVAAQLSGDKNLIADCSSGDIHTTVGVAMTGWSADKIHNDNATRTKTKNIHFGILFGQTEDGTVNFVMIMAPPDERARVLAMSPEERADYEQEIRKGYRRYFKRYPGIKRFIESQRLFAKEHGYVETIFGMRQTLVIRERDRDDDGHQDMDFESRDAGNWKNQSINAPVQGSAHQLLVCGLVNILRQSDRYKLLDTPVMDVHDALYFSTLLLELPEATRQAKYLMDRESLDTVKRDFPAIDWQVPIMTEAEAGLSLGCKVDLEGDFTVGGFLLEWYRKRSRQVDELDQELAKVAGVGQ